LPDLRVPRAWSSYGSPWGHAKADCCGDGVECTKKRS
jgi:hypothetical protein